MQSRACALALSHLCSDCTLASILWLPKAAVVVEGLVGSVCPLLLITWQLPQPVHRLNTHSDHLLGSGHISLLRKLLSFAKPVSPLIDIHFCFLFMW